ncbi:MAG: ribosomal protein S18-alanine N-acetyltransferase [Desulfatiglandales bacterium]
MIALVSLSRDNYQHYLDGILEIERISFPSPWSPQAFLEEIENPLSHLWTLNEEGAVVGYICFWLVENIIQILDIAIHPTKRRQGNACRLLTAVIEKGISHGADQVWLEARVSNLPARDLYKKFGFKEVGLRSGYYRDTYEDAVTMTLTLPD